MAKNIFFVARDVKASFRENLKNIQDVRFDFFLQYGSAKKVAQNQQEL
jgi:hypothetical protein